MELILEQIERAAWSLLQAATSDPKSGFRYVTLATVASGQPQARMVVLRRVDTGQRLLEFHTDTRSKKWADLAANPKATVLGYDATTRLQLRVMGDVTRLEGVAARDAWNRLPPWTRATYAGGPPGDEQAFGTPTAPAPTSKGYENFGVLQFWATTLDWFLLQRQDNRRALFAYGTHGHCTESLWIAP